MLHEETGAIYFLKRSCTVKEGIKISYSLKLQLCFKADCSAA
jgi:hypothetical protein